MSVFGEAHLNSPPQAGDFPTFGSRLILSLLVSSSSHIDPVSALPPRLRVLAVFSSKFGRQPTAVRINDTRIDAAFPRTPAAYFPFDFAGIPLSRDSWKSIPAWSLPSTLIGPTDYFVVPSIPGHRVTFFGPDALTSLIRPQMLCVIFTHMV